MEQKKDSKGRNLKQGESQLKDGRYRYRYTDKYGKRNTVYAWKLTRTDKTPSGKKDGLSLRELEKEIERDESDGILTHEAKNITVYEMIFQYFETKPQIANATMQNYISMVNKNVKPNAIGHMKVADVKRSDIKKFYAYLYKEKKFAVSTIQVYQNIIYPAFQMAVDDDWIRKNPCKDCMKDYVRGSLTSTRYPLTRQEQKALLEYVKDDNVYSQYYTLIAFLLGTGCRISEALGLTWDNIDFENASVYIDHQIIYKKVLKEGGAVRHYAEPPKNRTNRTIPLQKEILNIMRKHKQQTYFMSKASGCEVDGYKDFVFLNRNLKLYTPNTFTRALHNIRDTYNRMHEEDNEVTLPDFSAHTFRHTFCTRMAENGIDVKVLQEIMGHKTIAITMQVYNHVLEGRAEAEMQRVSSALVV